MDNLIHDIDISEDGWMDETYHLCQMQQHILQHDSGSGGGFGKQ